MKLCEFFQRTFTYCGSNLNESEYVKTILEKVIFNIDNDDLTKKVAIFNMDDNDINKIFKGNRPLSKPSARYIISHLDMSNFADYLNEITTDDAKVLLCKEFEDTIGNANKDNIAIKLSSLLADIIRGIADKDNKTIVKPLPTITDFEIENELTNIINILSKTPLEKIDIDLTYEPVKVDKKIENDGVLKDDIRKYVIGYYLFIKGLFDDVAIRNSACINRISEQVKYHSNNLVSQNLPQEVIFDKMVDWLKAKIPCASNTSCRIIIAFFVQNCEVFHAIAQ